MRSTTILPGLACVLLVCSSAALLVQATTYPPIGTAAVATWNVPGCVGTSTFVGVAVSGDYNNAATGVCPALSSGTSAWSFHCDQYTAPSGQVVWQIYQAQSTICSYTSNGVFMTGINGDFGCINLAFGGSIVLDCTSTGAAKVGTTITSPPMTTNEFVPYSSTVTPSALVVANFATWSDTSCLQGSGPVLAQMRTNCYNTNGDNTALFNVTCATPGSASSAWTIDLWAGGTATCAGGGGLKTTSAPSNTYTGSGLGCTALTSGSIVVDCSLQHQSMSMNFLPAGAIGAGSSSSSSSGGGNGGASSTAISSTGGAYDPSVWLGTYTIAQGCDQTQCCCARTSTITASGDSYTFMGTNLAGQCGASVPASVQVSVALPTSDTVTYTIDGQNHTATLQSSGVIADQNNDAASCSATLSKSSSAGATATPINMLVVLLLSAIVAAAAF